MSEFEYSPTVLYDIFYETGTRLIGRYVRLNDEAHARGDEVGSRQYLDAIDTLTAQRQTVSFDDQERQRHLMNEWNTRYRELGSFLESPAS